MLEINGFEFGAFMSGISRTLELPEEEIAAENAMCSLHTIQTPLIIDPNSRFTHWLPKLFKLEQNKIEIQSMTDPKLQSHLELAVQTGKVFVVKNAERIDPVFVDLLHARLGSTNSVIIGVKKIRIHKDFKLVLISSGLDQLPTYFRDLVTVIDASITETNLEGLNLGEF